MSSPAAQSTVPEHPLRLAHLASSVSRLGGGMYASVRQLSENLRTAAGVNVTVFGPQDSHTASDLHVWRDVPVRVFPVRGPGAFAYAPGLLPALQQFAPELLHVHGLWMYPSLASLRWSQRTRRPVIVSPRGMLNPWAMARSAWKKRLVGKLFEHRHLHSARCLHALNENELLSMRQLGLRNPICVIPNGIDPPGAGLDEPPPWSAEWAKGRQILLFLGRLHPMKGVDHLIEAVGLLHRAQHPGLGSWAIVIAGWGPPAYRRDLERLVGDLDLAGQVQLLGALYDAPKHAALRAADAFILPSHNEGLSMAILEAWSYGLPVLMTPECFLPEGFEHAAAIRIGATSEAVAQGLRALFESDAASRSAMGARGRALVEHRYAWPSIAREMREVYRWAIGGGNAPACVSVL